MKKVWTIVIASVVMLGAAGLFFITYYPEKAQNILIPEIKELPSLKIRVNDDSLHADLSLEMRNSGPFRMNIDSLIYEVHFDTVRALDRAHDVSIVLRPGESDTFSFPVSLPHIKIFHRIRQLQHRDSADIKVDARVVYSTIWGRSSLRHKKTSRIAMPRPPELDVEKIEYAGRSGKLVRLVVHLAFNNRSAIMLRLSGIRYRILLGDLAGAEGRLNDTIGILPHSVSRYSLPVEVTITRPAKTLFLVAADRDRVAYFAEVNARITANEVISETEIMVTKKGEAELWK